MLAGMDRTDFVHLMSRRRVIQGRSTSRVEVGARYNSPEHKYKPWMLTSTMIEEEDEDDLVERSSGVNLTPTALHTSQAHEGGNCQNGTTVPGAPYAALQGCQASRLAVIAASHVATATRKLLKGLLRSGHHRHSCGQQYLGGHAGFPELGNKAVVSAKATAAPVTTPAPAAAPSTAPKVRSSCRTAATADKRSRQSGAATAATANDRKPNIVGKNCRHERRQHLHCQHVHHVNNRNQHHVRHPHLERSAQQVSTRLQKQPTNRRRSQEPQPQPPRGSHLVRLMDGDDVRLAMQALQLAAQIHDHVWGPDGAPPCNREALLDAASPLYDTAMAAARAIQHRALHALVKQAVRRYVNPYHGSPDDVLQVILELLTGCGGAAAPLMANPLKCADGRAREEGRGHFTSAGRSRGGDGVNDGTCRRLAVAAVEAADGKAGPMVPQQQPPGPRISKLEMPSPSLDCSGGGAVSCDGGASSSGPSCSAMGTTESFTSIRSSDGSSSLSSWNLPKSRNANSCNTNVMRSGGGSASKRTFLFSGKRG
ncbi:hypothetical protein Vretimale_14213 [Volvox reticuliferus]|uniref:Uncharacterized protein n=1 Tax=Volvox reticuliferus TaxID=1737510 RepID=A0A8J4CRA5_9CHLO|nr:hypothetical protein Vretifemale_15189 [Volvox reticuliferus]GIM10564.1 hypothetical protein Vretimale_14213 [Volvox reticuliferus]